MAERVPPEGEANETEAPPQEALKSAHRVVIKKYANRRLYNTGSSSYVTLEHLSDLVKQQVDFVVFDAKTNEDITRQVLTQIIFEAENSGQNLMPIQFLRQLIQLYGAQTQSLVPSYLEMSLDAFAKSQEKMSEHMGGALGGLGGAPGFRMFEDQIRQNMSLFGQAMKMFTPFAYVRPEEAARPAPPPTPEPASDGLAEMKSQLEAMQRQIERLAKRD
jgi:polyhydroxyalkanoate synthesis repressor PhaR